MHIINLTLQCKTATGDGTKIVCMNSDYVVRVNANDCGTFLNAPIKKLIVRHGMEYYESPINELNENGTVILQATLPPLERNGYVDLGVCGKESETSAPIYTSTSARFECDKSVLTGVVVFKTDPVLKSRTITENGTYKAVQYDADGFYEVDVQVSTKIEEERTVDLAMANGDQVITPSGANRTMQKVTITKPRNLIPENIQKGITIAGVTGVFEGTYGPGTAVVDVRIEKI